MRDHPLLDLHDTWRAVHAYLNELQAQAEDCWKASTFTWLDMMILRQHALNARQALGRLPPGILNKIAAERADQ